MRGHFLVPSGHRALAETSAAVLCTAAVCLALAGVLPWVAVPFVLAACALNIGFWWGLEKLSVSLTSRLRLSVAAAALSLPMGVLVAVLLRERLGLQSALGLSLPIAVLSGVYFANMGARWTAAEDGAREVR